MASVQAIQPVTLQVRKLAGRARCYLVKLDKNARHSCSDKKVCTRCGNLDFVLVMFRKGTVFDPRIFSTIRDHSQLKIMRSLHLPFAILSALLTLISAAIVIARHVRARPRVHLPTHNQEPLVDQCGHLPEAGDNLDPFNVSQPEDFIDGYPLHEEEFWKRVSKPISILYFHVFTFASAS